jgi:hypothetical protein
MFNTPLIDGWADGIRTQFHKCLQQQDFIGAENLVRDARQQRNRFLNINSTPSSSSLGRLIALPALLIHDLVTMQGEVVNAMLEKAVDPDQRLAAGRLLAHAKA